MTCHKKKRKANKWALCVGKVAKEWAKKHKGRKLDMKVIIARAKKIYYRK